MQNWMNMPGRRLDQSYHIIGDSAYPCLRELMTPYKRYAAGLTDDQKKFNKHLSSKRQVFINICKSTKIKENKMK